MINLNEAIFRIVQLYNNNPAFNVEGVATHYINYSPQSDLYKNTCASFIHNISFTGTPARTVADNTAVTAPYFGFDEDIEADGFSNVLNPDSGGNFPFLAKVTTERYEPILQIRTVFTGSNALINASLHYQRVRQMLKQSNYQDMSLIGNTKFVDASIFFEGRYLIRYQSDAYYLCFLEVEKTEDYIEGVDELLKAYSNNQFTDLLTQREIEVNLNG